MSALDAALVSLVPTADVALRDVVLRDQAQLLNLVGDSYLFLGRATATDYQPWPDGLTVAVTDVTVAFVGDTGFPKAKVERVTVSGCRVTLATPQLTQEDQWVEFADPSTAQALASALGE